MDKVKNKNVVNNISMQIKDFSNESSFRAKIKERKSVLRYLYFKNEI